MATTTLTRKSTADKVMEIKQRIQEQTVLLASSQQEILDKQRDAKTIQMRLVKLRHKLIDTICKDVDPLIEIVAKYPKYEGLGKAFRAGITCIQPEEFKPHRRLPRQIEDRYDCLRRQFEEKGYSLVLSGHIAFTQEELECISSYGLVAHHGYCGSVTGH